MNREHISLDVSTDRAHSTSFYISYSTPQPYTLASGQFIVLNNCHYCACSGSPLPPCPQTYYLFCHETLQQLLGYLRHRNHDDPQGTASRAILLYSTAVKRRSPRKFSHGPTCKPFSSHTFHIRQESLVGCTCRCAVFCVPLVGETPYMVGSQVSLTNETSPMEDPRLRIIWKRSPQAQDSHLRDCVRRAVVACMGNSPCAAWKRWSL